MKISIQFQELEVLAKSMGATASSWVIGESRLSDRERLIQELQVGKEIPLAEVEISHGGLLTYKGEQVILYIKDTRKERDTLLYDKDGSPRFHIAECRTLDRMRREGRFERYVVTNQTSGIFLVESTDRETREVEELEAELGPCKNCLSELNWKNYKGSDSNTKSEIWNDFLIDDFFSEFSTFFQSKPKHTDKTAPTGGYAKEWPNISDRIKHQRDWNCEKCKVHLSQHRRLLHCHHISGVVSDNSPSNIRALCVECHSKEPAHQWMKTSHSDKLKLQQLRLAQGLTL